MDKKYGNAKDRHRWAKSELRNLTYAYQHNSFHRWYKANVLSCNNEEIIIANGDMVKIWIDLKDSRLYYREYPYKIISYYIRKDIMQALQAFLKKREYKIW